MAKFARCGENMLINIDTINTINFHPHSEIVLSIHTNDSKMLLLYKDKPWDRKLIRNFIDDIRYYFTLVEQAPCFWELMGDIEKWLDEREADLNKEAKVEKAGHGCDACKHNRKIITEEPCSNCDICLGNNKWEPKDNNGGDK